MVPLRNEFTVTVGKTAPRVWRYCVLWLWRALPSRKELNLVSHQQQLTHFTGTLLPSSMPARDCVTELGCRQKWDGMTWVYVANGEW